MSFLVIDDFCDTAEFVKASAFAAGFDTWNPNKGEVGSSIYEGMGFWGHHALMLKSLMQQSNNIIVPNTMFFRSTNVGMEKAYIHSDREYGNYTCICYLSKHEEESGTAFFMHKRTGLTEMPSFEEMKDMGIFEELKEDMTSRDPDKWVQTDYVSGRYNRALIFKAPLFHSRFPLEGMGNDAESGRLVWACHFYKLASDGELF
jgi:hypothetical protein